MSLGMKEYNKAAKIAYQTLSASDKEALKERGSETTTVQMKKGEVRKIGAKIFLKIQREVSLIISKLNACQKYHSFPAG